MKPEACEAFRWVGQPMNHCDDCGHPAWEHQYDRALPENAGPFGEEWECRPWPPDLIAQWRAQGLVGIDRAGWLLSLEAKPWIGET